MSSTDEISTNDKQFIIECLKNLDEDRLVPFPLPALFPKHTTKYQLMQWPQINLNKVAKTLGYGNVFSAGNRLRSLRNRYGFANFEGKTITGRAVAGEEAGIPAPVPAPERKRGRPRVKNVAPKGHVAVEVTNKRKREDDNNTNNTNNNNEENNGDAPKEPFRHNRKPASTATTTTAESEATTNGHGHGHVHGPGKTTTFRPVHFPRFPTPSKRRKKQAETTATHRRQLETPSRRIFRIAAQMIGRARSERRVMRSGLKLVFKLQV